MKKLLWLGIMFTLLVTSHTLAATSFNASSTGTTLNAQLTGIAKGNTDTFRLVVLTAPFPSGTTPLALNSYGTEATVFNTADIEKKAAANGTINWKIENYSGIKTGTSYYLRAVEIDSSNKLTYASSSALVKTTGFALLPLTVSSTGTTLNVTLTGATNLSDSYKAIAQATPFSSDTYTGSNFTINPTDSTQKTPSIAGGPLTWSLVGYNANTTYYVRILELPKNGTSKDFYVTSTATVRTGEAPSIPLIPLTTKLDGANVIVSGKINASAMASGFDPANYTAALYFSKTTPLTGAKSLTDPTGPLTSKKTPDANGAAGINDDGTYYWYLSNLSPSTVYYIQQTITVKGGKTATTDVIDNFNSSSGTIIVPGSAAEGADLNKRSYTLLSGFPSFTVLPDPDLCAQQRAAGQNPQFCDINDVLNYFLKLLIGLSAVSLVFRIMYEGYVVLTSDTPFKVSSAKGGLITASLGLVLALSAYLILNTINPKLVNESINVNKLSIGVTQPDTDITPITQQGNLSIPTGPVGACNAGLAKVIVNKSVFYACKTISSNLTSMLTAAYAANITLMGGGFRTKAEQTATRIKNCNGNTTDAKATCNPPTAVPGFSNHESGLAFDFTCDNGNATISTHDNKCFLWLQTNAATYGFKNFAKEPWHWSVDGR